MKKMFAEWIAVMFQMLLVLVMAGVAVAILGIIAGLTARLFVWSYNLVQYGNV